MRFIFIKILFCLIQNAHAVNFDLANEESLETLDLGKQNSVRTLTTGSFLKSFASFSFSTKSTDSEIHLKKNPNGLKLKKNNNKKSNFFLKSYSSFKLPNSSVELISASLDLFSSSKSSDFSELLNSLKKNDIFINPSTSYFTKNPNQAGQTFFIKESETTKKIKQGWKLHVSSVSNEKSMCKIIDLILPILKTHNVVYKYAHLATMQMLDKSFTQKGKFITLYPKDLQQAQDLAKEIDNTLNNALISGKIKSSDLALILNDALLGKTGGLYARYGECDGYDNKIAEIQNNSYGQQVQNHNSKVDEIRLSSGDIHYFWSHESWNSYEKKLHHDNRNFPWPDNLNELDCTDPFPDTPLSWTYFQEYNGLTYAWVFDWENTRKKSWKILQKEFCSTCKKLQKEFRSICKEFTKDNLEFQKSFSSSLSKSKTVSMSASEPCLTNIDARTEEY